MTGREISIRTRSGTVLLGESHPLRAISCDEEVVIILEDLGEQINVELDVFDNQDGFQVCLLISSRLAFAGLMINLSEHTVNFIHQFLALEALFFHDESDGFFQPCRFSLGQFLGADDDDGQVARFAGWRAGFR